MVKSEISGFQPKLPFHIFSEKLNFSQVLHFLRWEGNLKKKKKKEER